MNTIVTYKRKGQPTQHLKVTETVLKTIEELAKSHEQHMFHDDDIAQAITEQGWNIAPYQVNTSISHLIGRGYSIHQVKGKSGWYTFDASIRIGRVSAILAVSIMCPECGSLCDLPSGSSMICVEEKDIPLTCEECGLQCHVPSDAFNGRR